VQASNGPRVARGGDVKWVAYIQGLYFSLTGLWPLLHMPSFLRVTGAKVDLWLVRSVGILVLSSGLALLYAAHSAQLSPGLRLMAVSEALGLGIIEAREAFQERISKIYLLDAMLEALFVLAWLGVCIL
jgi:hypothetical protein